MKLLVLTLLAASEVSLAGPKYGPNAIPLSKNTSHDFFVKNAAPDFWALMPFYTGQETESACSAAAMTTVLNAARRDQQLTDQDELVTHKSLTEKYSVGVYKYSVCGDPVLAAKHGVMRQGISVQLLAEILGFAVDKLKIKNSSTKINLVLINRKNMEASRKYFHDDLVRNEKSADDFMLLNFTQGVLTGDSQGMVGHIAAVGAYDAEKKQVLILDPDRKWYEPYWSPEDKVFDAIADKRSDKTPGYVYLKVK